MIAFNLALIPTHIKQKAILDRNFMTEVGKAVLET